MEIISNYLYIASLKFLTRLINQYSKKDFLEYLAVYRSCLEVTCLIMLHKICQLKSG